MCVFEGSPHNHDGIMQTALSLINKLIMTLFMMLGAVTVTGAVASMAGGCGSGE